MGVVLLASLGLAALRSGSATWASAVSLLACGVLALGVVGVACGGRAGRAWWLGFGVFGWGYMAPAFWDDPDLPRLPPVVLLNALMSYIGPPVSWQPGYRGIADNPYFLVGHSLCSLVAACLGGMLAHAFFAAPSAQPGALGADQQQSRPVPDRWRRRLAVIGLAGPVVFMVAALAWLRTAPGLWAGATVLLTWGVLCLTAVAAVCRRGRRRAACLGATLFGAGYMILVSGQSLEYQTWPQYATNRLLNAFRPWLPPAVREFPAKSDGIAFANARVLKALDQLVPMRFPQATPLEDVLKSIVAATRGSDGRAIPIYVDPIGLLEAEKTMRSPVTIVLDGVPLRTTLRLVLGELGLSYGVKDGLILINSDHDEERPAYEDPFLVIGQCLLALLAAGLGGLLAPLVHDARDEAAERAVSATPVV